MKHNHEFENYNVVGAAASKTRTTAVLTLRFVVTMLDLMPNIIRKLEMQVEQNQEARSMASFRIQLKKVQFCRFWVYNPHFQEKKQMQVEHRVPCNWNCAESSASVCGQSKLSLCSSQTGRNSAAIGSRSKSCQ